MLTLATVVVTGTAEAQDPIQITAGTLEANSEQAFVEMSGDGFSLAAHGNTSGNFFGWLCGNTCEPGPLNIRARWSGSDFDGTATVNGQTFAVGLSDETTAAAFVNFDGEIRLPPLGKSDEPFTVKAPFSFTGRFSYPISETAPPPEVLVGKGTATLTFTRFHEIGTWIFQSAVYEFHK
jgi:hypothetical protein